MAVDSSYSFSALTGKEGSSGTSVTLQYSVDGESNWHETYAEGDLYMRTIQGSTVSSAMRIVGEDGESPYACAVSNENQNVPTDTDYKPVSASTYSFIFTAYKGSTKLTAVSPSATLADGQFSISTPSGMSQDTAGTLTWTSDTSTAITGGSQQFSVTVTYYGGTTETKTISIVASAQGEQGESGYTYEIDCPVTYKAGNSVTFNFYKVQDGTRTAASVYYHVEYTTDGSTWGDATSSSGSTMKGTGTSATTSTIKSAIQLRCRIYTSSSSSTPLDEEYTSMVSDGSSGTAATAVYLGNENITLACDKDGKLKSAYSGTVTVGAYLGTSRIASSISASSSSTSTTMVVGTIVNGTTSADGTISLSLAASTAAVAGTVTVTIVANGITFTKIVNISVTKDGATGSTGSQGASGTDTWTPVCTNVTRSGNKFTKTGGSSATWDSQVYSSECYSTGCFVSAKISSTSGYAMVGLNTDPTTDASYSSIDYAFYFCNGKVSIYENGTQILSTSTAYTTSSTAKVIWDGATVYYYLDSTLIRSVARTATTPLYLDSSIHTSGLAFTSLSFGAMGKGATGNTGASGITPKCSATSLTFNQRRTGVLDYDSQTFTCSLYQGSTILTPTSTKVEIANGNGVTVSGSLSSGVYTVTATASSGGTLPTAGAKITVTMVYNSVTYTFVVPVTTEKKGKYLGAYTSAPTANSTNQGSYFCWTGTNGTYYKGYVYTCIRTASSTYSWVQTTDTESNMTALSDACSCSEIYSNAPALTIIKSLVAQSAFIDNLFANEISVGNTVQSSNYIATSLDNDDPTKDVIGTGFCLGSDGTAHFNDIEINGFKLSNDYYQNLCLGALNLQSLSSGNNNIAIGRWSLCDLNTGEGNVALGKSSMTYLTTGSYNVGLGFHSLYAAYTGSYNIGIGYSIMPESDELITGNNNIGIGNSYLSTLTSGCNNIAIGQSVGSGIGQRSYNTCIGYSIAVQSEHSILIGESATVYGNYNIGIGYDPQVGTKSSSNYNIAIGYQAGQITSGSYNICIGYQAVPKSYTSSNQISIGNRIYMSENGNGYMKSRAYSSTACLGVVTARIDGTTLYLYFGTETAYVSS